MDERTFNPSEYVDQMAILLDLQLKPEHRPGVIENFERIIAIAQLVNEFPLPDGIEAAPVFEP
jgi:Asp-tRNA(Asn)/Glu-tRNA(Gln) amidotransferase C subunit